jgi:hypothetical protein
MKNLQDRRLVITGDKWAMHYQETGEYIRYSDVSKSVYEIMEQFKWLYFIVDQCNKGHHIPKHMFDRYIKSADSVMHLIGYEKDSTNQNQNENEGGQTCMKFD